MSGFWWLLLEREAMAKGIQWILVAIGSNLSCFGWGLLSLKCFLIETTTDAVRHCLHNVLSVSTKQQQAISLSSWYNGSWMAYLNGPCSRPAELGLPPELRPLHAEWRASTRTTIFVLTITPMLLIEEALRNVRKCSPFTVLVLFAGQILHNHVSSAAASVWVLIVLLQSLVHLYPIFRLWQEASAPEGTQTENGGGGDACRLVQKGSRSGFEQTTFLLQGTAREPITSWDQGQSQITILELFWLCLLPVLELKETVVREEGMNWWGVTCLLYTIMKEIQTELHWWCCWVWERSDTKNTEGFVMNEEDFFSAE